MLKVNCWNGCELLVPFSHLLKQASVMPCCLQAIGMTRRDFSGPILTPKSSQYKHVHTHEWHHTAPSCVLWLGFWATSPPLQGRIHLLEYSAGISEIQIKALNSQSANNDTKIWINSMTKNRQLQVLNTTRNTMFECHENFISFKSFFTGKNWFSANSILIFLFSNLDTYSKHYELKDYIPKSVDRI